nr:ATP-binding cassette domain-containing protein [Bradyrhizobium sp. CCBAU 11361]
MTDCLRIERLAIARGGKQVVHGVNLEIPPGQVTALLGANGAGKSSLVLAAAGALPVSSGDVLIDEKSIGGLRPEQVRRLGIAAVPEGHHVLSELSVLDNLRVAGHHLPGRKREDGIEAALDTFPELRPKLGARAGSLSGGQQQMVVLAQAIVERPRYILADELSFGLAPVIVARLVPVIIQLAADGVGVLLIEQFTHIALRISHRVHVMERDIFASRANRRSYGRIRIFFTAPISAGISMRSLIAMFGARGTVASLNPPRSPTSFQGRIQSDDQDVGNPRRKRQNRRHAGIATVPQCVTDRNLQAKDNGSEGHRVAESHK